jgi:hypothetical protein
VKRHHTALLVNCYQQSGNVTESHQDLRVLSDRLKIKEGKEFHRAKPSTGTQYGVYRVVTKKVHEQFRAFCVWTGKVSLLVEETVRNLHPVAHGFKKCNPLLKDLLIEWRSWRGNTNGVTWTERWGFDESLYHISKLAWIIHKA